MNSRKSQLASIAVLVSIAVIISLSLDTACAWADIVGALNQTNDVHYLMKVTRPNGTVDQHEGWLKNKRMLRSEHPERIEIDNGHDRLVIDQKAQTAQFMDSFAPFEDFIQEGLFELLLLFRGEETPFTADLVEEESTGNVLVFEVTYRSEPFGTVWVDPISRLPLKLLSREHNEAVQTWEAAFDYDTISSERFNLDVPSGYRQLPRRLCPNLSGHVIDDLGNPVANALVHVPGSARDDGLWGQTDTLGIFQIKLPPFRTQLELPMFIRAYCPDDPYHVAWRVILNPKETLSEGESNTQHAYGTGTFIEFRDQQALYSSMPGSSGEILFRDVNGSNDPLAIKDIILQMTPATVVTGHVTDDTGRPVANTGITVHHMSMRWDSYQNQIGIQKLSDPREPSKAFTLTDSSGYYVLGNLPDLPVKAGPSGGTRYEIRLEAESDGYFKEQKRLDGQTETCDFRLVKGAVLVRGTVIDDHGEPLVCRQVEVEIEGSDDEHDERDFDIEDALVDETGRFELSVPRVPNLVLELALDNPYLWLNSWSDKGVDKDEKDPEFIYYLGMQVPIAFEEGKNEYWIEIVPHRPDITITIHVSDDAGHPLAGIPVFPYSPKWMGEGMSRDWSLHRLAAMTDTNGRCVIKGVPRAEAFAVKLSGIPESFIPFGFSNRVLEYFKKDLSSDMIKALAESRDQYESKEILIDLAGSTETHFTVNVTLSKI
ncbi:MAG: carboxypeptidase regulatory-like domain-containing protein [Phycisphaeraceae bacterium]|nr:carboxypeptidase regulatory-like domain-containing protein [Phycisphaeraceae bacterium]